MSDAIDQVTTERGWEQGGGSDGQALIQLRPALWSCRNSDN